MARDTHVHHSGGERILWSDLCGCGRRLVWGYVRKLDRIFTELYNLIDNIPVIIYMTLIALMLGKTTLIMGVAMIGFGWLATARNVRNLVFMYA